MEEDGGVRSSDTRSGMGNLCALFSVFGFQYGYFARVSWILGSLFLFVREIALGILENCGLMNANDDGLIYGRQIGRSRCSCIIWV